MHRTAQQCADAPYSAGPAQPIQPRLLKDPVLYGVAIVAFALGLPFFRYVQWLGDEGMWLHAATRLLRGDGLRLPAEFLSFSPGAVYLVAGWMKLFGSGLAACRVLALITLVVIAAGCYAACARVCGSRRLAAGCAIGWAATAHQPGAAVSHHWFGTVLAIGALYAALASLERAAPRRLITCALITSGICAGATALFVPHVAVVAALCSLVAALTIRRARVATLGSIGIVPALSLALLWASGAFKGLSLGGTVASTREFATMQGLPFGADWRAETLPVVLLFPLTGALLAVTLVLRRRAAFADRRVPVLIIAATGAFFACFPRADVPHILFVAPMALPLLAWATRELHRAWGELARRGLRRALGWGALAILLVMLVPAIYAVSAAAWHAARIEPTLTPRGRVRFGRHANPADLRGLLRRLDKLPRHDGFLFYPYCPMLPYLLDRLHVAHVDIFHPGLTSQHQYLEDCRAVMARADWVVMDKHWIDPVHLGRAFPALRDRQPRAKARIERAISRGFERVQSFGRFELWRRAHPSAGDCRSR